jgi:hypothetical protein
MNIEDWAISTSYKPFIFGRRTFGVLFVGRIQKSERVNTNWSTVNSCSHLPFENYRPITMAPHAN